jgi:hypothetical protein
MEENTDSSRTAINQPLTEKQNMMGKGKRVDW